MLNDIRIIIEKGYKVYSWDPFVDEDFSEISKKFNWYNNQKKHTFFIGTKHADFVNFKFPKDSIVIDPFRFIYNVKDCKIIRIGDSINEN